MWTRPRPSRGFTLLELLVAMTIMVIIATSLYSSLYTGFRARRSAEKAIVPLQAAQAALDMIEQDVRGAVEPNTSLAGAFQGEHERDGSGRDRDSLILYSSHHQINGDTSRMTCGIGLIELSLVRSANSQSYELVRQVTDNLLSIKTVQPIQEVLCRRVRAMSLRYFDGSAWTEAWDSQDYEDTLPLAVEVTLEIEPLGLSSAQTGQVVSRYDRNYLNSVCRLKEVFTLPCGVSQADVADAAQAAAQAPGKTGS